MSTHHEYCGNNIHTAELILSHSIRLSSHIMTPINSGIDSSDISFSGRMDEWISRQHMILVAAQEHQLQSDQHKRITMSTRMFCIHLQWVEVTNYFPSIKDHIRLLDDRSPYTSLRIWFEASRSRLMFIICEPLFSIQLRSTLWI